MVAALFDSMRALPHAPNGVVFGYENPHGALAGSGPPRNVVLIHGL